MVHTGLGHAFGPEGLPDSVRGSLFALGAERSAGTSDVVDGIAGSEPGLFVRRADAEVIPPLSDYEPFWRREVPFLFLTAGRSRYYHTPEDTPEKLDYGKMAATARWLSRYVRASAARPESKVIFEGFRGDDAGTLRSLLDLLTPLAMVSSEAEMASQMATELLSSCGKDGRLPGKRRREVAMLVELLETKLR